MSKGQIKRLAIVIVCAVSYTLLSVWIHSFGFIEDKIINWVVSIIFPAGALGLIGIVVLCILDIYEKLRDYIIDGN